MVVETWVSVVVEGGRVSVEVSQLVIVLTEMTGGGTEVVVETVVSVVVDVLTLTDVSVIVEVVVDVTGGRTDVSVDVVVNVLQEVMGVGPAAVSTGSVKIKVSVPIMCVLTVDVTTQEAHGGEVGGLLGTMISVG